MSELEQVTQPDGTTAVPAALARDRARAVFGQTMGLVALTAGVSAIGAYVGRDLPAGWGFVCLIGAIVCIVALNVAIRRSEQLAIGLLFGMGALLGSGVGPTLAYYADVQPVGAVAGGGRDGALHRGVRRVRLRDAARPRP